MQNCNIAIWPLSNSVANTAPVVNYTFVDPATPEGKSPKARDLYVTRPI